MLYRKEPRRKTFYNKTSCNRVFWHMIFYKRYNIQLFHNHNSQMRKHPGNVRARGARQL